MITHLTMVHRKRGNPNWGNPLISPPAMATKFEDVAFRLGLTKENYSSSSQLRIWCQHNSNRYYVPVWLLKEWASSLRQTGPDTAEGRPFSARRISTIISCHTQTRSSIYSK